MYKSGVVNFVMKQNEDKCHLVRIFKSPRSLVPDISVSIAGSPCSVQTVTDTVITCRSGPARSMDAQVQVQRSGWGLAKQVNIYCLVPKIIQGEGGSCSVNPPKLFFPNDLKMNQTIQNPSQLGKNNVTRSCREHHYSFFLFQNR